MFQTARIDAVTVKQMKISSKELVRLQTLKMTTQAITFGFQPFGISGCDIVGLICFADGIF
jgi:hypothetical protein